MRAKLARFYGWSHEEIVSLEVDVAEEYWQAVTVLEAQELTEQLKLSIAPNLEKKDFKRYSDNLHRLAYPKAKQKTQVEPELTSEELAKRIGELIGKR